MHAYHKKAGLSSGFEKNIFLIVQSKKRVFLSQSSCQLIGTDKKPLLSGNFQNHYLR